MNIIISAVVSFALGTLLTLLALERGSKKTLELARSIRVPGDECDHKFGPWASPVHYGPACATPYQYRFCEKCCFTELERL